MTPHENIFEQNALNQARATEQKTVPIRFNEKIVGEAVIEVDEVGVRVISTEVTDPVLQRAIGAGIDIGPMPIFYHKDNDASERIHGDADSGGPGGSS